MRAGAPAAVWHERFHQALAMVLRERRIAAEVAAGSRPAAHALAYLCFAVPQPGDVLLAGKKIIGGAQRLRRGALLQHGSIQLPAVTNAAHELAQALADALSWQLDLTEWSTEVVARIEELARTKYGQDSWNKRR
jgi:lipoate-protein ligase A